MTQPDLLTDAFRALSARLGQDPLQVQGPGGNTSIKDDAVMWIKASGTELADALIKDIFVAVDRVAARDEIEGPGDGSCKDTVLDPSRGLRPSIETTFHAALDWPVVAHTHSVATLVHAISPEGRAQLAQKLEGLDWVDVPYAKPGLPLTRQILARVTPQTRVVVLHNHGLICCGESVQDVADTLEDVEARLALPPRQPEPKTETLPPPEGFEWANERWLAHDGFDRASGGTYYPDHAVFLGAGLPVSNGDADAPAMLVPGQGVLLRQSATSSQRAMLRCLSDVLLRLPKEWSAEPIGTEAEAELLNWDAEKYRQALAAGRSGQS